MFCCFGWEAYGILAPRQGMESAPPALEGEVPNTGPPEKSQEKKFKFLVWAIAGKTSSKIGGVAGTYYGFLAHSRKKKKKMLWQGCLFEKKQLILMFEEVRFMNNECLKFTWVKREKSLWVILT